MPRTLDPAAHREALAALVDHLGEAPDLDEAVPAESQLFAGILMLGGGAAYFLCRRFGRWEILTSFAVDELQGVEAVPSFGALGYEVRVLHQSRTIRFSDVDEETAHRIVAYLKREGAEGLDARNTAQRARTRATAAHSGPMISDTTSLPTSTWSGASPKSPWGSAAPPSPFAAAVEIGQIPDDDDEDDDDDDDDDDGPFAAVMAAPRMPAPPSPSPWPPQADAETPPAPEAPAKPKRKLLWPTILVALSYAIAWPFIMEFLYAEVIYDPDVGPYAIPVAHWALFGFLGGLFGAGLGRGIALAILGIGVGAAVGAAAPHFPQFEVLSVLATAILGYGYVSLRKGASPVMKASVVAIGARIIATMFDLDGIGGSAVAIAAFWGIHYAWERSEQ